MCVSVYVYVCGVCVSVCVCVCVYVCVYADNCSRLADDYHALVSESLEAGKHRLMSRL